MKSFNYSLREKLKFLYKKIQKIIIYFLGFLKKDIKYIFLFLKEIFKFFKHEKVIKIFLFFENVKKKIVSAVEKNVHQKMLVPESAPGIFGPEDIDKDASKKYAHWILWTAGVFVFVFIVWAHFSILDVVTMAPAKVIPSSQIQVIQNLEGGIIKKIFVKEGQIVQSTLR